MSRTYREREDTDVDWYAECHNVSIEKAKAMNRSDNWWSYSLPHDFRNTVNRTRRAMDKQSMYNALNKEDDPQLFSAWNCKDNHHWDYW